MPETAALREAIVRGAALDRPSAATHASRTAAPIEAPFVGREREVEGLRAAWSRAARGRGALTLVTGEAGIGKSRLSAELALIAEAEGGRVLIGTTGSPEHRPYQSLLDALRSALPIVAALDLAPPLLGVVGDLIPELRARRSDLPMTRRLEEAAERARLLDALAQTFIALARARPVLLILEDLHWAGAATLEALTTVVQRIENASVAVVATARDDEMGIAHPLRVLARKLQGTNLSGRVALGPLDRGAVARLASALAIGARDVGAIAERAFERSEGNPLFATELLRDAATDGDADRALPEGIRALVRDRADRLASATRTVAEAAAVTGHAFTLDLVRDVAGVSDAEVLPALDELLDRHLVRELTPRSRYDFAFTHHLVQAALYDGIDPETRTRRHRRAARALEALADGSGESSAEIALHFERGGVPESAAQHYALAAERTADLFANAEALALAERGLALEPAAPRTRFALLSTRAEIAGRLGDDERHRTALTELAAVAVELDDDAACTALSRRIERAFRRDDRDDERDGIEALAERARRSGNERWRAVALDAAARRSIVQLAPLAALEEATEAREIFARVGDDRGFVRASSTAANACAEVGRIGDAERLARETREYAERNGDPLLRIRALSIGGRIAQARQDYPKFADIAAESLELSRSVGDRHAEAYAHYQIGTAFWSLWRVDDGVAHLRATVDLFESLGSPRFASSLNNLAGFLVDLGAFEKAAPLLERAIVAAEAAELHDTAFHAASNLAEIAWLTGDIAELERNTEAASRFAGRTGPRNVALVALTRSRALRARGDFEASLASNRAAFDGFIALERFADAIEVLDDRALTFGRVERFDDAAGAVRAAADLASQHERKLPLQYPIRHYWIAACAFHDSKDESASRTALARAREIFRERHAAIGDAGLRETFAAIGYHRTLVAAHDDDIWPKPGGAV
jgi:tetratricopeptide (TPR) repeat protein